MGVNQPAIQQKVKIQDDTGGIAHIDHLNHLVQISEEHHEVHEGEHYEIIDYTTLATDASVTLEVSPVDVNLHFVYAVNAQSEIELNSYEGTSTSGGTSLTATNNNRTKADDSQANPVLNPTIDSQGTRLGGAWYGDASSNQKARATAHAERSREYILADGTTYTFDVISKDDSNVVSYMAIWYEESTV